MAVPRDRKLIQLTCFGVVEVGPGVVTENQNPGALLFEHVDGLPAPIHLIALKVVSTVANVHLVVLLGRFMKKVVVFEIFDDVVTARPVKGLRHADFLVGVVLVTVPKPARTVFDIPQCGATADG